MEGPPAVMEATPARAPRGAARFASGKAFTDSPHTAGAPAPTLPGLRRGRGGRAHSHAAPRSQPPGPDRAGPAPRRGRWGPSRTAASHPAPRARPGACPLAAASATALLLPPVIGRTPLFAPAPSSARAVTG